MGIDLPLLLTKDRVAHELSLSDSAVDRLISTGRLRSVLLAKKARRIPRDAFLEFLGERIGL